MPSIALDQTFGLNSLLLCVVNANGQLYEPDEGPTWRIVKVSTGAKVLPSATATQDEHGRQVHTGVYVPKAADGSALAAAGLTAERHRIEWVWTHGGVAHSLHQTFDVVEAGLGFDFYPYVSVATLRAAGMSSAKLSNDRAMDGIREAHELIDDWCRQTFAPTRRDLRMDGTKSGTIFLSEAIVGIEAVYTNDSEAALNTAFWRASTPTGRGRIARGNPFVELVDGRERSMFEAPAITGSTRHFDRGQSNQRVVGMFGAVARDQTPPEAIRRACVELVALRAGAIADIGRIERPAGDIISETTDNHTIAYASGGGGGAFVPGVITDRRILAALHAYRAPMAIATPADPW
jgi:hypothetical protein